MAFTEDMSAFFGASELESGFAVEATWNGDTVNGIFDNEYFGAEVAQIAGEASKPKFHCNEADVAGIAQDDTIEINDVEYTIISVQPDGTGFMVLILEEA